MSFSTILTGVANFAKGVFSTGKFFAKKHAPELMIAASIGGFGLTIYETVQATNKTNEILEVRDKKNAIIDRAERENDEYTEIMAASDRKALTRSTRTDLVKTWAPVAVTFGFSVISVCGAYKIVNGRYVATSALAKSLESRFERLYSNVERKYGKDEAWHLANDIQAETLEAARKEREENRDIAQDNKHKKFGKKAPKTAYNDIYSQIFDQYSDRWRRHWTADQVWDYLMLVRDEMEDKLKIQKHLFLNEIYDRLGLPRTAEGQVVGWIITRNNHPDWKENHHIISFGLEDMPEDAKRDFLKETINENIWIRLRFNPDGLIYNMIDRTDARMLLA